MNTPLGAFFAAIAILCAGYFLLSVGPDNREHVVEWGRRALGWVLPALIAFPFLAAMCARKVTALATRRLEPGHGGRHSRVAHAAGGAR